MKDIDPIVKAPKDRGLNTLQKLGRAVGAGLLLLPLTACTPSENAPNPSTSQLDTPTPGASETTKAPAEFQSGATGQYAPDALAALADNHDALVNVFRITGTTPEEIAENTQKAIIGAVMAGTTKTDLDRYTVNGQVSGPNAATFIDETTKKYGEAACEGMDGKPCSLDKGLDNLKRAVLYVYSLNHLDASAASFGTDFMLGADTVSDVKVVDGSIKSNHIAIQYDIHSSNNYAGSAAETIANKIADSDTKPIVESMKEWSGHRRITQTYERAGDHWNIVASSSTERIAE